MQNMNPWRVFAYWHAAAGLLSKVQDETLTTLAWLVKEEECVLSHCIRFSGFETKHKSSYL